MAAHSMAAFNDEQFQELIALGTTLGNQIKAQIEQAHDTFKRILVDSDTILMEDDEYKQACSQIVTQVGQIMEDSDIEGTINSFQKGAEAIAERVGITIRKNEENLEQALSSFNAAVKRAGDEIGQ